MSEITKPIGQIAATTSKAEIVKIGKAHAAEIINGDQYDLIKSYVDVKRYELYLKTLIDEMKAETVKKIAATESKDFEFGTSTASITKRRKFDFSNDAYWKELDVQTKEVSDQQKKLEKMMKDMTEGSVKEFTDPKTGEVKMIQAPSVQYAETLMVKIA